MRHIAITSVEAALYRGKSLEQFLGGRVADGGELFVSWVELRPTSEGVEVWHYDVPDPGESFADLYELIPDEQQRAALTASPDAALHFAQTHFSVSPSRWVNQSAVQDEFLDFVRGARQKIFGSTNV